ncbi:MAG: hypothetical protein OT477_02920 [Chloroflexi bacterium]|nr:hypothetical protein [Chloroflexota bacterium]
MPCPPPLRRCGWGNVVGVGTADVIRSGNTRNSFRPTHPHATTTNTLVGQWGWVARANAICFPHVLRRAPHPNDVMGGGNVVGVGRPTQYVRETREIRFGRPTPTPQRPIHWWGNGGGWHGPMPYVPPMFCAVPPTPTTMGVGVNVGVGGNVVGVGRPTQYVRETHKIRFGRPTPMRQRPTPWRLPCYGWVARANAICFPHVLRRAPHPYDVMGGGNVVGVGRPT